MKYISKNIGIIIYILIILYIILHIVLYNYYYLLCNIKKINFKSFIYILIKIDLIKKNSNQEKKK